MTPGTTSAPITLKQSLPGLRFSERAKDQRNNERVLFTSHLFFSPEAEQPSHRAQMTHGAHELMDQQENMKTVTKVNKERQAMKGFRTFREPLGEMRNLEKIAFVGVESGTSPCQVGCARL